MSRCVHSAKDTVEMSVVMHGRTPDARNEKVPSTKRSTHSGCHTTKTIKLSKGVQASPSRIWCVRARTGEPRINVLRAFVAIFLFLKQPNWRNVTASLRSDVQRKRAAERWSRTTFTEVKYVKRQKGVNAGGGSPYHSVFRVSPCRT